MNSRHAPFAALLAASVAFAVWVGCSSSSSTPAGPGDCHSDTTQCKAGTTCWPASIDENGSPKFDCLQSNPTYGLGSTCEDSIGIATCADGMTCDVTQADAGGLCTYYCNVTRGLQCPAGYLCRETHVGGDGGPVIQLCRKNTASAGDGGDNNPGTVPPGYLPDGGFDPNYDGGAADGGHKPQ